MAPQSSTGVAHKIRSFARWGAAHRPTHSHQRMSVAVSLNPRLKHRAHQQPHQRLISVRELFEIRDQRQLCAVVRLRGNARNMRCLRALRHVAVTQPIARHTDH